MTPSTATETTKKILCKEEEEKEMTAEEAEHKKYRLEWIALEKTIYSSSSTEESKRKRLERLRLKAEKL